MANVLMDFSPSYSISPWVCVSGNNSFYHLLIEKKKCNMCAKTNNNNNSWRQAGHF